MVQAPWKLRPEGVNLMIPVISVVGKTNSGKTTLVERLIIELKKRGYRVGAIKHDAHEFEIDREGKDSWRMTKSGAETVVLASRKKIGVIEQLNGEKSIDEIIERFMDKVDIVITEGYKKQEKPKIEVTRSGELLCGEYDNLIATVINGHDGIKINPDISCFQIDEIEKISDMIENFYSLNKVT